MTDAAILAQVSARRQALIDLTQNLIRIPTLNPSGAPDPTFGDDLAARLESLGFIAQFVRTHGPAGNANASPRGNLIARIENGLVTGCVSTAIKTWSRWAMAEPANRSGARWKGAGFTAAGPAM